MCLGQAASAAAVRLAAGTPGKRMALPHSRIIIHQPATEGGYGQGSDIEIQAREILYLRAKMNELLSKHTGQSIEQIEADADRDRWFTAEQALEYGFIDNVVASAGEVAAQGRPAQE